MSWAGLGYRLWQLASWPESLAFDRGDLRGTQERLLRTLLGRQARTDFGRRHGLDRVGSYQSFRERVPLSSYEDLAPYLPYGLSREDVRIWEPTGGSSGGSKWIPWTPTLQAEFRRAVSVWIFHLLREDPRLREGRAYWQLTPKTQLTPPPWLEGHEAGFASDGEYLGALGRWLERSILLSVAPGPDLWQRTVTALREAGDLRLISCWSPSFLLCLRHWFGEVYGDWQPRRWWPNLRLISCWTQGPSAVFEPRLAELFPGVRIQPKGLLSTEAVVTIPLGDQAPLAYRSHFFELLGPEGAIPAWEWRPGQEGTVVVSTGGGFTRYNTGDRVRVESFWRGLPCLSFLGRDGVSDRRGEKLAHPFLEAILEGSQGFVMLGFEQDGYVLFCDKTVPEGRRREQVEMLEQRLKDCYSYRDCRELGQLRALRGYLIDDDALAQFTHLASSVFGQREGSAKLSRVTEQEGWAEAFRGRYL